MVTWASCYHTSEDLPFLLQTWSPCGRDDEHLEGSLDCPALTWNPAFPFYCKSILCLGITYAHPRPQLDLVMFAFVDRGLNCFGFLLWHLSSPSCQLYPASSLEEEGKDFSSTELNRLPSLLLALPTSAHPFWLLGSFSLQQLSLSSGCQSEK
jgi:hypothetical protein